MTKDGPFAATVKQQPVFKHQSNLSEIARANAGWLVGSLCFALGAAQADGAGPASPATNEVVCAPSNSIPVARPEPAGTRRMIERLDQLRAAADPRLNPYGSREWVDLIRKTLPQIPAEQAEQRASLTYNLGVRLVEAGEPEAGLRELEATGELLARIGKGLEAANRSDLRMHKATAFMRIGEQANCLNNHNPKSCLFPLEPAAYHQLPQGSRGAIAVLTEQLQEYPQDLSARWLLNLAAMTLGEYPGKVPPQWLIPPRAFQSDCEFPRFPEIAGALGLDVRGLAGSCILDDFDNDGFIDILATTWEWGGHFHYFHNDGNGRFSDWTQAAGLGRLMAGLNIQQTDYNNDGFPDVWVLRGAWLGKGGHLPNSLLRINGDGTFTDVTEEAGLLSFHPTQTSVWFDYDGDGWLDLFIGNETQDPSDPNPCELYHNNHDGTFTECAAACGLRVRRFVKAAASADYDHDGRPDLYLSCLDGPNLLFHNDGADASGQWRFSDATARAGLKASRTFPCWFFDYDNDGWEDLFVSGDTLESLGDIAADYLGLPHQGVLPRLYHNNHDGTFTDATESARLNHLYLTMGCNFGDLDNDGWLDFYLGTGTPNLAVVVPNRMLRNAGGKFFQDVTAAGGFGNLQKGHGIAFADLDNDGNQDIYEVMGGANPGDVACNVLYHNPGGTNHWLKLKLEGTKSNRAAIGARLQVTVATPGGPRRICKTVNSGGSFGSSPLRQEIGLGDATAITSVEVFWPASGIRQVLTGLAPDACYRIREGDEHASIWNLKPIQFDLKPGGQSHSNSAAIHAGP